MFQRNETESEATPNQPLGEAFGQHQFRAATVEHQLHRLLRIDRRLLAPLQGLALLANPMPRLAPIWSHRP